MKRLFTLLAGILAWAALTAAAEGVPDAEDLAADAKRVRGFQGVIMIAFVSESCPYCKVVLDEFMIPTSRNLDYDTKLVMRRVEVGGGRMLRDFKGRRMSQAAFASRHGVSLVPTVLVFSPDGKPLGPPLIGLSTVDYYGYYFNEAIENGLAAVRQARP
ncbi:MAG: hypothetical protein AB1697_12930 [Pseudomonadota bacterium]